MLRSEHSSFHKGDTRNFISPQEQQSLEQEAALFSNTIDGITAARDEYAMNLWIRAFSRLRRKISSTPSMPCLEGRINALKELKHHITKQQLRF